MALRKFTNGGKTTLSGAMNGSTDPVTFTVASAAGFPTSGQFNVIIEDEILLVTSVSGNDFTANRAQEGTTIAAHSSGVDVNQSLTALGITEIIRQMAWMPYKRFTPVGVDDEFDDENFSGWTAVGTTPVPTYEESNDKLSIIHPGGDTASRWYAQMKAATINIGDWIETCLRCQVIADNYPIFNLLMADGVTVGSGAQVGFDYSPIEASVIIRRITGYNTHSFQTSRALSAWNVSSHLFMRMTYTAANTFKGQISTDGKNWIDCITQNGLTLTPTYAGFAVSKWGGSQPAHWSLEYFRKGP